MACSKENYLYKDQRFYEGYEEFKEALTNYEQYTKQKFTIRSTSYLANIDSSETAQKFIVLEQLWKCAFGKSRETQSTKVKKTRTMKLGCSAMFRIALRKNEYLLVTKCNGDHQYHDGSEEHVEHIPANRKLNKEQMHNVEEWLSLECPKKNIQEKLIKVYNKYVPRKDLDNLNLKKTAENNDSLRAVVDLLEKTHGARVTVFYDDVKNYRGLFFTTEKMRDDLSKYPEIVFTDTTYKLFIHNFILLLLMVEDCNGKTQFVGVGILADEKYETLSSVFEAFRDHHGEALEKVSVFMTDKDLTYRGAIREILPWVKMLLCEFHVKKAMAREVTTKKMSITPEERSMSVGLLKQLVQSSSEVQYLKLYDKLKAEAPATVMKYLEDNWHPCKDEWTRYMMFEKNLRNTTNNRLESVNGKIKKWMKPNDHFVPAIQNFFKYVAQRDRDFHFEEIQHKLKKDVQRFSPDSDEEKYQTALTPYGFSYVVKELNKSNYITLERSDPSMMECMVQFNDRTLKVTPWRCDCPTWNGLMCPCRHIFATRKEYQLSLYEETLCGRWKKPDKTIVDGTGAPSGSQRSSVKTVQVNTPKKNSESQKRAKLLPSLNDMLYMGGRSSSDLFDFRFEELEKFRHAWRTNEEVCVVPISVLLSGTNGAELIEFVSNYFSKLSLKIPGGDDDCTTFNGNSSTIQPASDNCVNVEEINLPPPMKLTSRFRSSTHCTVKLSGKKLKNSLFTNASQEKKIKILLHNLIRDDLVDLVLTREYEVKVEDIPSKRSELSEIFMEDGLDLELIQGYMDEKAFMKLNELIGHKIN